MFLDQINLAKKFQTISPKTDILIRQNAYYQNNTSSNSQYRTKKKGKQNRYLGNKTTTNIIQCPTEEKMRFTISCIFINYHRDNKIATAAERKPVEACKLDKKK